MWILDRDGAGEYIYKQLKVKKSTSVGLCSPVGVLLVLDVQVFECGDEGLGLEAPGGSCSDRRVADGALCADGGDVAPQRRSEVTGFIPGLSHAANVETAAEINAVEDLRERGGKDCKGINLVSWSLSVSEDECRPLVSWLK